MEVLGQQQGLLRRQLAAMQRQVGGLEADVADHSEQQATAKSAADELLASKTAATKALRVEEKGQARLAQAAAAAATKQAKLRVQLKAAEAVTTGGAAGGSGQQVQWHQLEQAERDATKHR